MCNWWELFQKCIVGTSDEPKTCYYSIMWCKLSKKKVASHQKINKNIWCVCRLLFLIRLTGSHIASFRVHHLFCISAQEVGGRRYSHHEGSNCVTCRHAGEGVSRNPHLSWDIVCLLFMISLNCNVLYNPPVCAIALHTLLVKTSTPYHLHFVAYFKPNEKDDQSDVDAMAFLTTRNRTRIMTVTSSISYVSGSERAVDTRPVNCWPLPRVTLCP